MFMDEDRASEISNLGGERVKEKQEAPLTLCKFFQALSARPVPVRAGHALRNIVCITVNRVRPLLAYMTTDLLCDGSDFESGHLMLRKC